MLEVSSMWTSTQKLRAYWRHPVFFSCKEVGVFGPEFHFWMEKSEFFQYKLAT